MSELLQDLRRAGLLPPHGIAIIEPLTGGVSSDISLVTIPGQHFCVKRALAKLKVAADWRAPVARNKSEVDWMNTVARILPAAVPKILADHSDQGWFAMAYLEPAQHALWKTELRAGRIDVAFAQAVGAALVQIHAATAGDASLAERFATDHIFVPIRLDPYLAATAEQHPDCAARLHGLIAQTLAHKQALVHGDVSPKNILVGSSAEHNGPVFLDAECAWWGDPAFDLAFCLNHLLLKCVWQPQWMAQYLAAFDALAAAYLAGIRWENAAGLELRAAGLLPGLLLARVDGKSPVEYLTTDVQRNQVRHFARRFLLHPVPHLQIIRDAWAKDMQA